MKALLYPVIVLSACLLQACSTSPTHQPEQDTVKASLDQPDSIKPQTFMIRGEVVIGNEVRTLKPCNSNQQFWLDISAELKEKAMSLSSVPYQPMYGELIGYLTPPSQTGYNGDYAARFKITNVNTITSENPSRCQNTSSSTRAFGNEPGWVAQFTPKRLTVQTFNSDKKAVPITGSQITAGERQYSFKNGELTLQHELCADGMSDSIYGWKSRLALNNESYKGCATLGNSDPSLLWVGQYFASSTQNSGFSVTLTIKPDHTAITQYTYNNGEPPIVEKGYWQQLNQEQIQVVMTRHQQQYLVSQRIFTRNGETLVAEKEMVGNVVYPLSNGGLVLYSDTQ